MTDPRKPLEIVIGGVQVTTVFDGQSSQVCVRGLVSRRPRHFYQIAKNRQMLFAGPDEGHVRLS